jgi:hypothetical protein
MFGGNFGVTVMGFWLATMLPVTKIAIETVVMVAVIVNDALPSLSLIS